MNFEPLIAMESRENRLNALCKFSPERRRDRYGIIFIWKLSNGMVSGFYDFDFSEDPRRGKVAVVKDIPVSISAKDRDLSLAVKGAKMFNLLPRYLRDYKSESADNFKSLLDKYLENIPDTPVQSKKQKTSDKR